MLWTIIVKLTQKFVLLFIMICREGSSEAEENSSDRLECLHVPRLENVTPSCL
jgi:hypothetical protein